MRRETCMYMFDAQPYLLGGYYHPRNEDGSPMDTMTRCSRYATEGGYCWQHNPVTPLEENQ